MGLLRIVAGALLTSILTVGLANAQPFPTVRATPTTALAVTASSAYTSGNVVGTVMTFNSAVRIGGYGGILQSVVLRDKAGNATSYDLFLFDSAPSAQTDKTAAALTAADLAKVVATVPLSGVVLGASATQGVMTVAGVGLSFRLTSGTTMYGLLVTRGTPTFASTSDVSVDLLVIPD